MQEYARIVVDRNMIVPQPEIRLEFFLHAIITGEACTLEPETRDEEYLYAIASGDTSRMINIEPVTLVEMYYNALLSNDISALPTPETRWEMFLYSAVTGEPLEIEPYTVIEQYLVHLTAVGGVEYIISSSANSSIISLPNSTNGIIKSVTLDGDTLVNYCTDGSKELTLNGDINVEGTFVTTTESVDNGKVDVMCEGNTLVNVANGSYFKAGSCGATINTIENGFGFSVAKSEGSAVVCKACTLKDNTTYTISFEINTDFIPFIQVSYKSGASYTIGAIDGDSKNGDYSNGYTRITCKRTTVTNCEAIVIGYHGTVELERYINVKNLVILEGDWTDKEIPPYFEGMKSVGQDDENGHKIEILSQNKNLIGKIENRAETIQGLSVSYEDDIIVINGTSTGIADMNYTPFDYVINLEKNSTYTLKFNIVSGTTTHKQFAYRIDKYNGAIQWMSANSDGLAIIDTGNEIKSISRIRLHANAEGVVYNDWKVKVQLEKSSVPTSYVQSSMNKKEISLNEPLRGVGDVKDKIVKIGGKWYIERNCEEINLEGKENWTDGLETRLTHLLKCNLDIADKYDYGKTEIVKCDKYISKSYDSSDLSSGEFIRLGGALEQGLSVLVVYVLKDNIPDIDAFKQNLQSKPMKVVYGLKTPTYEEITDPTLITYLDVTHISNDSIIPCNMKIKNSGYNAIIKPSTQYTIALDTDKNGTVGMNLGGTKTSTTNNIATITTPATLTDDSLRLYGKGIKASKVRLLEGDKTNWMPSFFEGMKSCFEDKLQDGGTYKMEILSNNRNLIDFEGGITTNGRVSYDIDSKSCNISASGIENRTWQNIAIPIKVCNGRTYVLSYEDITYNSINGVSVDKNSFVNIYESIPNRKICNINYETKEVVFTIPHGVNVEDLRIRIHITQGTSDSATINIKGLMLTESKEKLEFTSPEYNKIQFSSIEPLRKWDRFVFKDGQLMIERSSEQVTLGVDNVLMSKGSPSQVGNTTKSNVLLFNIIPPNLKPSWGGSIYEIKCDTFKTVYDGEVGVSNSIDCVFWGSEGGHIATMNDYIRLSINEEELSTSDLAGFENWLRDNNVNILYQTNEPTYEEVPLDTQNAVLKCYENGTLFIDTIISPSGAEIEYPIRKEQLFKAR